MDPTILFALAIAAAPAVLILSMLTVLGAFVVSLADSTTGGGLLRRPS